MTDKDIEQNDFIGKKLTAVTASTVFKVFLLSILVIQNSSHALTMRYSRISSSADQMYIASTAVLAGEVVKLFISFMICLIFDCNWNPIRMFTLLATEFTDGFTDMIKLLIPAALYVVQNNLTFMATSNLPAEIYQVLSNMKIISTAAFTVILLHRSQSTRQWFAILALAAGICCVQVSQSKSVELASEHKNMFLGLMCVTGAAVISGLAGVYFELILKTTRGSIWIRNIQLALFSLVFAAYGCYFNDKNAIMEKGFFFGYNNVVVLVIGIGAAGGIIVAVVIKFLDNILKGFASGASIILSCFVSKTFLQDDSAVNEVFVIGTTLVCVSLFMYANAPSASSQSPTVIPSHAGIIRSRTGKSSPIFTFKS